MATLWCTEYERLAVAENGVMCGYEPSLTTQMVTFTGATPSAKFNRATRFVRLYASADCRVAFGPDRIASASSMPLTAKVAEFFGVRPQDKVSVYDGVLMMMMAAPAKGEDPVAMAMAMISFASDPKAAKGRLEELAAAEARLESKRAAIKAERDLATKERVKADQLARVAGELHAKAQAEMDKATAERAHLEEDRQKLADKRASLEAQLQEYAREHALVKTRGKEMAGREEKTTSALQTAESDRSKAQAARNEIEQAKLLALKELGALRAMIDDSVKQLTAFSWRS